MNRISLRWILFGLAVSAAGCGPKVQAKAPEPPPPLAAPEPPPRTLMPIDPPPPPPVPVETPVVTPPARPAGRGAPPPTPPATTTAPPPETPPPPVLQTGSGLAELEQRAKERLGQAQKDMSRLTRGSLGSKDAQAQYDSAASFIRLAQNAMTAKNFVYAHYCADKAATLASLLVK